MFLKTFRATEFNRSNLSATGRVLTLRGFSFADAARATRHAVRGTVGATGLVVYAGETAFRISAAA